MKLRARESECEKCFGFRFVSVFCGEFIKSRAGGTGRERNSNADCRRSAKSVRAARNGKRVSAIWAVAAEMEEEEIVALGKFECGAAHSGEKRAATIGLGLGGGTRGGGGWSWRGSSTQASGDSGEVSA